MAVSFISRGKWSTQRIPPTCRKSLTNLITYCCIDYTSIWTGFNCVQLFKTKRHKIFYKHTSYMLLSIIYKQRGCRGRYRMVVGFTTTSAICAYQQFKQRLICRKSLTNLITYCCIDYTSIWTLFELLIGTDCTGSCKSDYHTISTTAAPLWFFL
jgi:hypothetical protein